MNKEKNNLLSSFASFAPWRFDSLLSFFTITPAAGCDSLVVEAERNSNDPRGESFNITATVSPSATGGPVTGHEPLTITFSDPVTGECTLSGTMGTAMAAGNVSRPDDTHLVITPASGNTSIYPEGSATLGVSCTDRYGNAVAESWDFTVEYAVYVSRDTGDDGYAGTRTAPRKSIQSGVDLADTLYDTASVKVAATTTTGYSIAGGGTVVTMVDGISLYGGYSTADWSVQDMVANETVVEDTRATGGADWEDPNRTVECNTTISNTTFLDGFTINGGGGPFASAVYLNRGCSPTISNNNINGGSMDNGYTYAISNVSSSPIIINNNIFGGGSSTTNNTYAIYIDESTQPSPPANSPTIIYNKIDGGGGNNSIGLYINKSSAINIYNNAIFGGQGNTFTFAIYVEGSSPNIYNNTINGGYPKTNTGTNLVVCIYLSGSSNPAINNNIILTEIVRGSNQIEYGVYETNSNSVPTSVQNNDFFNLRAALYRVYTPTNLSDKAGINSLAYASGNEDLNPNFQQTYDSSIPWFQVDHHLTSITAVNLRQGGLDGFVELWGFSDDLENTTRTNLTDGPNHTPTNTGAAGWSIGAYEYD